MRNVLTGVCAFLCLLLLNGCGGKVFSSAPPVELQEVWATDYTLSTPESALFDPDRDIIYVSNINQKSTARKDGDGFISKINPEGKVEVLYWVTGLNDPRGMALHNNVLYVADLNEIVAISTQTGSVLGRYEADRASYLNDVAADEDGNVYVTDSEEWRIYLLRNGRVSTWMKNTDRKRPNGLYLDGNRMLVTLGDEVRFLNPETQSWSSWTRGIKSPDGVAKTDGGFLVSSWDGEIYFVNAEGRNWRILNTAGKGINAADISYTEKLGLLLVPTFNDNRVVAYKLKR